MYFVCLSLAALLVATSLGTGDRLVWRIASRNLSTRSTATAELESNWARLARPKYYKRFRGKGWLTQFRCCFHRISMEHSHIITSTLRKVGSGLTLRMEKLRQWRLITTKRILAWDPEMCTPLKWESARYADMAADCSVATCHVATCHVATFSEPRGQDTILCRWWSCRPFASLQQTRAAATAISHVRVDLSQAIACEAGVARLPYSQSRALMNPFYVAFHWSQVREGKSSCQLQGAPWSQTLL